MPRRDPGADRVPCLLCDLELNRPLRLLLHDNRPRPDVTALHYVVNAKADQVIAAQLAIDCEIEKREFPDSTFELKANPDRPDLFQLQRRLLAKQFALIPRCCTPPTAFVAVSMNGSSVGRWDDLPRAGHNVRNRGKGAGRRRRGNANYRPC